MHFYELIAPQLEALKGQVVSVIGGGGKSTLLYKIGLELAAKNLRVLLSSSTKIQAMPEIDLLIQSESQGFVEELKRLLETKNIAMAARTKYKGEKLAGFDAADFSILKDLADLILIEADGSRQRSLKTHKEFEPVIPEATTRVIIICGADAVGAPLDQDHVHRAELFSKKWKMPFGAILTPEIIARELLSERSYLRCVPAEARVIIFINKIDQNREGGEQLARALRRRCQFPIFLGSLVQNVLQEF